MYDGANDVMLTIELMPCRAQDSVFKQDLAFNFNLLLAPDAADRIKRHKSHILINVHHGVFPDLSANAGLMEKISGVLPGQTTHLFQKRVAIAEHVAALINEKAPISLVHHVTFNVLVPGDHFARFVQMPIPHVLHLRPYVYSAERHANGSLMYGYVTMGASFFIDREIYMAPTHIPWLEAITILLDFVHLAMPDIGYIIPDGDTFGPLDESWNFRISHVPTGEKIDDFEGPLYRMDLVMHKATNFEATSYVKPVRTFDDRNIPKDLKADIGRSLPEFEQNVRSKREMAEKAGNILQVRTDIADPKNEPPERRGLARWLPFFRSRGK